MFHFVALFSVAEAGNKINPDTQKGDDVINDSDAAEVVSIVHIGRNGDTVHEGHRATIGSDHKKLTISQPSL